MSRIPTKRLSVKGLATKLTEETNTAWISIMIQETSALMAVMCEFKGVFII